MHQRSLWLVAYTSITHAGGRTFGSVTGTGLCGNRNAERNGTKTIAEAQTKRDIQPQTCTSQRTTDSFVKWYEQGGCPHRSVPGGLSFRRSCLDTARRAYQGIHGNSDHEVCLSIQRSRSQTPSWTEGRILLYGSPHQAFPGPSTLWFINQESYHQYHYCSEDEQ